MQRTRLLVLTFAGVVFSLTIALSGCPSSTPTMVSAPGVEGMARADAEGAILGAGLTVGAVTQAYSDSVPEGHVISQSPTAGTITPQGSAVDLVVSKGPDLRPLADAGPDQTANRYWEIVLDGTASSEPQGKQLTYSWTQVDGPYAELSNKAAAKPSFLAREATAYIFALSVSNGHGTSVADEVKVTVQEDPSLLITSPATTTATLAETMDIGVHAAGHVVSLELQNSLTGATLNGVPAEDGSFVFMEVGLALGDNEIAVTGIDNLGDVVTDSVVVTRNAGVDFLGQLILTPQVVFVGENTEVLAETALAPLSPLVEGSVQLAQITPSGEVVGDPVPLFDDGDVSHGDQTAGDGVFSAIFDLNESAEGLLYFRASAAVEVGDDGVVTANSTVAEINVMTPFTEQEAQDVLDTVDRVATLLPTNAGTLTDEQLYGLKQQIVAALNNEPAIESAALTREGDSVVARFTCGIEYEFLFVSEQNSWFQSQVARQPESHSSKAEGAEATLPSLQKAGSGLSLPDLIGSSTVSHWSPFYSEFYRGDPGFAYGCFEDYKFFNLRKPIIVDASATLEAFLEACESGVVLIDSHGYTSDGESCICTAVFGLNPSTLKRWAKDIKAGNLRPVRLIFNEDGAWDIYMSIRPGFIRSHLKGRIPNSLVVLSACNSMRTPALGDAFLGAGASAVVGFADTVWNRYAYDSVRSLLSLMLSDDPLTSKIDPYTLASAHRATLQLFPDDGGDPEHKRPPTWLQFRAKSPDLRLYGEAVHIAYMRGTWHGEYGFELASHVEYRNSVSNGSATAQTIVSSTDIGEGFLLEQPDADLAVGPDGGWHVVFRSGDFSSINYQSKSRYDQGGSPFSLATSSGNKNVVFSPSIDVGVDGVVHVAYMRGAQGGEYGTELTSHMEYLKDASGGFGAGQTIVPSTYIGIGTILESPDADLAVGPDGDWHVVFRSGGFSSIDYQSKSRYDQGGSPFSLANSSGNKNVVVSPSIDVGVDGVVHVAYMRGAQGGEYGTELTSHIEYLNDASGGFGTGQSIVPSTYIGIGTILESPDVDLAIGPDGDWHVLFRTSFFSQLKYTNLSMHQQKLDPRTAAFTSGSKGIVFSPSIVVSAR